MAVTSFVAAILLATNGFGFAVLAVPFFLMLAPPGEAIPLIVIVSLAISLLVLPGLQRSIDPALLLRLTIGSLIGLPVGLVVFSRADPLIVRMAAGATITIFAAMLAWDRRHHRPARFAMRPGRDLTAGTIAGIATGLVGMPGPPVMVYLMLARAPVRTMRATLIAFFALVFGTTLAADVVFLGVPGRDWGIAASLIPLAWAGGALGLRVGDRLGERMAAILAIMVLTIAGLYTLAAAARAALW
jgi:uncharacterized membrane protein YfcA